MKYMILVISLIISSSFAIKYHNTDDNIVYQHSYKSIIVADKDLYSSTCQSKSCIQYDLIDSTGHRYNVDESAFNLYKIGSTYKFYDGYTVKSAAYTENQIKFFISIIISILLICVLFVTRLVKYVKH